ncbi:hypothetical protein [Spirillospora sp. NPDC047279]|uniref:hypothetical protein n=1 Tax=Spirillospora sp. NPDC047279 TaxID=3155478 RepID=UPI0033DA7CD6
MSTDELRAAHTSHTHLFPGAVIVAEAPDGHRVEPCGLLLRFADDVEVPAELLLPENGTPQSPVLAVKEHTTAAGTDVPPKTWLVKEITPDGPWVSLKLGARIPVL